MLKLPLLDEDAAFLFLQSGIAAADYFNPVKEEDDKALLPFPR